jgi:hypothetical protein
MRGRGRRRLLRLDPADGAVFRFAVELGVRVAPALGLWLLVFYLGPVGLGPRVVADAGDLPGDLDVRPVGLDGEVAARDLLGDDRLGELTDDRELVAEVAFERRASSAAYAVLPLVWTQSPVSPLLTTCNPRPTEL